MKVALVHDYLNEFGGAERVLLALSEMYPESPIYTSFAKKGSPAYEYFKDKDVRESWAAQIPWFKGKLHSPLRFLAPLIWESFNLDEHDVVISSSGWYMPKGVLTRPETLHVSYVHTPPRYLYGYKTSIEWQKYWIVKMYASLVNKGLREYDFLSSQRVNVLVANSYNVRGRIKKFYRRDATVIYPPIEVEKIWEKAKEVEQQEYYLVLSRIVGGKGLQLAVEAANRLKMPLKVVGAPAGWSSELKELKERAGSTVEYAGYVRDEELAQLYAGAKGFLVLAEDEDFGMTPVEAMAAGTPVIAYRGGGYVESVVEGETGVFFDEQTVESLMEVWKEFDEEGYGQIEREACVERARRFSEARFMREMGELVEREYQKMPHSSLP